MRNDLLAAYLLDNGIAETDFAAAVGCTRTTVRRYIAGERVPEPAIMDRISEVTGGAVDQDSWTPILIAKHRARRRRADAQDLQGDAA